MKILASIFCLFLSVSALAQNNAGQKHPLCVIDGVIVSNQAMKTLNPNEVKNISILKGKAAIALYGVKGANGVILITTRNHKITPRLSDFARLKRALSLAPDSLKPLIAIDDSLYKGNINAIDTAKVGGIEFVKPEWATVIYGKAGAHGVVDIKMKPQTKLDTLKK